MNDKNNMRLLITKILATSVAISLALIMFFYAQIVADWNGNWNTVIKNLCFILIPLMSIILIWTKKYKKTIGVFTVLFFIIFIINTIYYKDYSMKVEPLIHLNKKYKIAFSEMKIIETTKTFNGDIFGHNMQDSSATIEYNGYNIYIHYENGWKDDYEQVVKYKKNTDNINQILKTYTNDFDLVKDPLNGIDGYDYIIYLYSSNANVVENIINQLNNYVIKNEECNYHLYITKNKEFYDVIRNIDINKLSNENYGTNHKTIRDGSDLFKKMITYSTEIITVNSDYNNDIFINNGCITDSRYQNPENFEYIVFYYNPDEKLQVFGIKHWLSFNSQKK